MKQSKTFVVILALAVISLILGLYFLINNDSAKLSAKAGIAQEWAAGICLGIAALFFFIGYITQSGRR